eukprot:60067-Prorocentrum_minimum.AAC.2
MMLHQIVIELPPRQSTCEAKPTSTVNICHASATTAHLQSTHVNTAVDFGHKRDHHTANRCYLSLC